MVPSEEVRMVPELPTETNNGLEVVGVVEDSSFSLQEKMMKLKRNTEKIMSRCFTWFPFWWIRRTQFITSIGLFCKNVGILLGGCLTAGAIWGSILEEMGTKVAQMKIF